MRPNAKIRSYNLNAFASPWVSFESIAKDYKRSKVAGDSQLQVSYNTVLGLPFEVKGDVGNAQKLYGLREDYIKIPNQVKVLTCGIDTQDNKLEYEKEDGSMLTISISFIDSGGHYTDKVYEFVSKEKSICY